MPPQLLSPLFPHKITMSKKIRTLRRRLYFDIEVAPNLGMFWEAGYKKNIGYENIIKERAIICICYKWEDEKEVSHLTWDDNQSDKAMLDAFIKIANEATEMIGHNGDRFDLAWVRTRCLYHKIEMLPSYITIDTLKVARSKFKFNSNKLDYIAKFLGVGKKIKTDFNLWKNILLNNDEVAMAKMVKYCKMDVIILEKVHKQLATHMYPTTHYGVIFGQDRESCPECGSDDVIKYGNRVTVTGLRKQVFKCITCTKFHRRTIK